MMKRLGLIFAIALFVLVTGVSLSGAAAQEEPTASEDDAESLGDMFEDEEKSEEDYYRQDRVLMTATKHLMDARKAPAISSVITEEEIRNMGARDIRDVLRRIPGVGLTTGVIHPGLEVRGIATTLSEKILLLVDGHRMNNHHDGTPVAYIAYDLMVENIKRIEVVRGPGSALYGTNAFAGVINIITKNPKDIDSQQISMTGGSFKTGRVNGLFSHNGDSVQISGHVDCMDTDGPEQFVEEDNQTIMDRLRGINASMAPGYTDEFVERWDAGLKIKYGDISFTSRVIDKKRGPIVGATGALNDESVVDNLHVFADLIYTKSLSDDLSMTVKFYGDQYDNEQYWEAFPEGFTGLNDAGFLASTKFKNRVGGIEISTDYVLGDHFMTAGLNYEYAEQYDVIVHNNSYNFFTDVLQDVSDTGANTIITDRNIWAVYFQDMWEISAYDSLTLGVRYDHYDDFGDSVNPRVGYVHEFGNGFIAKALYGSAFRAPTFQQLYAKSPVLTGNTELDSEKINTYEIGLVCPFLKHYTLTLNYFHNDVEDLIRRGPKPAEGPAKWINVDGKTQTDGAEAELTFGFAKDIYGHINCSYQQGKDENDKDVPDVPQWRATAGLNFGLSKYFNVGLDVAWVGKREKSEEDSRDDLPSYTLVDLTLVAKNFFKSLEVSASVHNLFDEESRSPVMPQEVPSDIPTNKRMFLVEARYKF